MYATVSVWIDATTEMIGRVTDDGSCYLDLTTNGTGAVTLFIETPFASDDPTAAKLAVLRKLAAAVDVMVRTLDGSEPDETRDTADEHDYDLALADVCDLGGEG